MSIRGPEDVCGWCRRRLREVNERFAEVDGDIIGFCSARCQRAWEDQQEDAEVHGQYDD